VAYVILCVCFVCFVRSLIEDLTPLTGMTYSIPMLRHKRNTRYGRMANPLPDKDFHPARCSKLRLSH
jgi:hypothetical protein